MRKIKSESGRSLMETLAVLVVMAILLLASLAGYHFLVHQYKKQQTVKQISELAVRYKVRPVHADDEKVAIKTVYPESDRSDAYTMNTADDGRVSLHVENSDAFSVVVNAILDDSCVSLLENGDYDAVLATNAYDPSEGNDYFAIGRKWLQDLDANTLTSEQKDALRDFLGSGVAITRENIINKICAGPTIGTAGLVFGDRCPSMGGSYWYSGRCWACPSGQKEDKFGNCCSNPNDCNVCQDSDKQNNCFQWSTSCYPEGSGKTFCESGSGQCVECVNDLNCSCRDGSQHCSRNHCCPSGFEWNGLGCACPSGQEACGLKCCDAGKYCVENSETCCTNTGANTTKCGSNNCCESGNCTNSYCCPAGEVYASGNGKCCAADRIYTKDGAQMCCSVDLADNGFCPDTCGTGCSFGGECHSLGEAIGCGVCVGGGRIERKSGVDAACCNETTWEMKTVLSSGPENCGECDENGHVKTVNETACKECSNAPNWLLRLRYTDGRQHVVTHGGVETCCKNTGAETTECTSDDCCNDTMTCATGGHCCPTDRPVWDAATNTCVDCLADTDCDGVRQCHPGTKVCCPANKPYYSTALKMCVECLVDNGKGTGACPTTANPLCQATADNKNQVCNPCPDGKVWDATLKRCVGCLTDTDCAGVQQCNPGTKVCCPADKPYYSTALKMCVECLVDNGKGTGACPTTEKPLCRATADNKNRVCNPCPDGKVWNATTGTCECPDGTIWDATLKRCVGCLTDTDCAGVQQCNPGTKVCCPANKPYYSTALKMCVECLVDNGKGTGACPTTANPLCQATADNKNQVCNPCPTGQVWNSETKQCESSQICFGLYQYKASRKNGPGKFQGDCCEPDNKLISGTTNVLFAGYKQGTDTKYGCCPANRINGKNCCNSGKAAADGKCCDLNKIYTVNGVKKCCSGNIKDGYCMENVSLGCTRICSNCKDKGDGCGAVKETVSWSIPADASVSISSRSSLTHGSKDCHEGKGDSSINYIAYNGDVRWIPTTKSNAWQYHSFNTKKSGVLVIGIHDGSDNHDGAVLTCVDYTRKIRID